MGMGLQQVLRLELSLRQRLEMRQELVLAQEMLLQLDDYRVRDDATKIEEAVCERYLQQGLADRDLPEIQHFLVAEALRPDQAATVASTLAKILASLITVFPKLPFERVLRQSKLLAENNDSPSAVWGSVLERMRQSNIGEDPRFPEFEQAFWNLTVGMEDPGELFSAITWAGRVVERCASLNDATQVVTLAKTESAGIDQAFFHLDEQLDHDLGSRVRDLTSFVIATRLRLQERRYDSGGIYRHIPNSDVRALLQLQALRDQLMALRHLPMVMAVLVAIHVEHNAEVFSRIVTRLDELCGDKEFAKSKDYKRTMLRGLYLFYMIPRPAHALAHFVGLAHSSRELIHGMQALEMLQRESHRQETLDYPDHATSMDQLVIEASDGRRRTLKSVFGFSDAELDALSDPKQYTLIERTGLLEMCVTYASLCRLHDYARGIELSGEILRRVLAQGFYAWRYSHDRAKQQLAFLENIQPWKDAISLSITLGVSDALTQRIASIRHCGERLAEHWHTIVGYPVTADLDGEFQGIVARLREPDLPDERRKHFELEARRIRREYGMVSTLRQLMQLEVESIGILTILNDALRMLEQVCCEHEGALSELAILRQLISAVDVVGTRRILLEDTDAPFRTMNVGRDPVESCQRWNEWTRYNRCLPAYVVDANKRVLCLSEVQSQRSGSHAVGRSVIRLLPVPYGRAKAIVPLILIEPLYNTLWTPEVAAAIWTWAVRKAEALANANNTPIMVGTKDAHLVNMLNSALQALRKKTTLRKISVKLPESLNEFEYSDTLGKELKSGARISNVGLTTFFVDVDT